MGTKKQIEIVFTGAAATKMGAPIVRADLIKHAETMGYVVAKRVKASTKVLVASRTDTIKAEAARRFGVCVLTYGAFLEQFGGDVPRTGKKPDSWVDMGVKMANGEQVEYL